MLKSIGYWPEKYDEYAAPDFLADNTMDERLRSQIVAYLDQGEELFAWLGFSHCRFRCGIGKNKMGCRDLTDGEWVWPEGFSHYIKNHSLGLPSEFIEYAKRKNFDSSVDTELREKIDALKKSIDSSIGISHDPAIWTAWLKSMGEDKHFLKEPIGRDVEIVQDHVNVSLDDLFGK